MVPTLDKGHIVGAINRFDITHYSMEKYLAEAVASLIRDGRGGANGIEKSSSYAPLRC